MTSAFIAKHWFPANVGKAAVERAWLWFTPVWGAACAAVMVTRLAEDKMGDAGLLAFGAANALGAAVVAPWLAVQRLPPSERADAALTAVAMVVGCVVLSFGLNFFQTPFFFDVLHMRYGFQVSDRFRIDRNPMFLYLLTIPYFATYTALCCGAFRVIAAALPVATTAPPLRWAAIAMVPFATAFLETALNANPFSDKIFCYDDLQHALGFGTACYGISFVLALPVWLALGGAPEGHDDRGRRGGVVEVAALAAVRMFLVVLLDAAALGLIRQHVAGYFTTIIDGSGPFGGCLDRV